MPTKQWHPKVRGLGWGEAQARLIRACLSARDFGSPEWVPYWAWLGRRPECGASFMAV